MQITCNTLWWYCADKRELYFHTPGDPEQRGYIQCYTVNSRHHIRPNYIRYSSSLVIPPGIHAISLREAQELFPDFPLFQHGPTEPQHRTATEAALIAAQNSLRAQSAMYTEAYNSYIRNREQNCTTYQQYTPTPPSAVAEALAKTELDSKPKPALEQSKRQPKHDALSFRTGLELTAIYQQWQSMINYADGTDHAVAYYNKHIVSQYKSEFNKNKGDLHTDGHCVEWSTSVYEDWSTLKKWWEQFYCYMRNVNYYPRHPDTVCGGGHIHVDLPDDSYTYKRIQHLCYSYPVLPWIFTQAEDTDSANNITLDYWKPYFEKLDSSCLTSTKEYAVGTSKYKSNVIEFRLFQAASSWEEQKLHIEFAHAIVAYCVNSHNIWRPANLRTKRQLSAITKKQAVAMFKEFCAIIGFDWKRCQYLFKANLYPRWHKGYTRC